MQLRYYASDYAIAPELFPFCLGLSSYSCFAVPSWHWASEHGKIQAIHVHVLMDCYQSHALA